MRLVFELVAEGCQFRRLAVAMRERLPEQPVGEPRVPRQEWTVEVRPDRTPDAAAFPAALAVVAEPGDDPAEWLRARVQVRPSRVILAARQRATQPRLEVALPQDI